MISPLLSRRQFVRYSATALMLITCCRDASAFSRELLSSLKIPGEEKGRLPSPAGMTEGIYVPGWKAVSRNSIDRLVNFVRRNGLNTLMIDVKNARGELFYTPRSLLARRIGSQARTRDGRTVSLPMDYLLDLASHHRLKLIARHVMFRDLRLYQAREDFRLWSKGTQQWVDMRQKGVVEYNLDLLTEEKKFGFSEIALDYIRFPATNKFGAGTEKCAIIDSIVRTARETVGKDAELGVQVFGYTAWHHRKAGVGQRIPTLAPHVDVVYPMLYPSHFWPGSFGFKDPSRHPYEIIAMGYKAAMGQVGTGTRVIPMIQAFRYSREDVRAQLKAVRDLEMPGYICWNSAGAYERFFPAEVL